MTRQQQNIQNRLQWLNKELGKINPQDFDYQPWWIAQENDRRYRHLLKEKQILES